MGRASNRKKAQRQAGPPSQDPLAGAEAQRQLLQLAAAVQVLAEVNRSIS